MAESPTELHTEIEKLEARHAEHPEGRYFVPLANAYRKLGDLDHAEELLRQGLQQHPDYLSAHIVLGRCLADRGATPEAAAEFQYVLSIDPQNLIALRTLGELEVSGGRPVEAARWYEQLLAVDPMNEEARRALEALPAVGDGGLNAAIQVGGGWWDAPAAPAPTPADAAPPESLPEPLQIIPEPVATRGYPPVQREDRGAAAYDVDGEELGLDASAEVVTETIAELYARQGLHDRAAEVYRELIRRRGGDDALQRRLAELEVLAAGGTLPGPAPVLEAEPEPVPPVQIVPETEPEAAPAAMPELERETGSEYGNLEPSPLPTLEWPSLAPSFADHLPLMDEDPFAASFQHGFAAVDPDAALAQAVPEAEGEAEPEPMAAPAGPTIARYLADLVAWRPTSVGEDPAATDSAPDAAVVAAADEGLVFTDSGWDAGFVEDLASPLAEVTEAAAGDIAPDWIEPIPADTQEGVLFPWETSESSAAPVNPGRVEVPEPAPDFELESFFAGTDPEPAPPAAAEAPSAAVGPGTAPAPAVPEDEDDLESFQAWLRSLKR